MRTGGIDGVGERVIVGDFWGVPDASALTVGRGILEGRGERGTVIVGSGDGEGGGVAVGGGSGVGVSLAGCVAVAVGESVGVAVAASTVTEKFAGVRPIVPVLSIG
jgi:hypothetical protein